MKKIVESPQLFQIFQELKKQSSLGNKLYPQSKDIFEFLNFDISKLKILILGDIPHTYSNGIWLDCSNNTIVSKDLEYFYNNIEKDLYNLDFNYDRNNKSLKYLKEQGVILSSCSLVSNNIELFKPFWKLMFEEIFNTQAGLHIIAVGKEAQKILVENSEPFIHYTYYLESWDKILEYPKFNIFSIINKLLEKDNGKEFTINWLKNI
jgi:uracil DNA glycosylase